MTINGGEPMFCFFQLTGARFNAEQPPRCGGRESRSRVTTDVVCHHRMGPSQTDGLDLDQGAFCAAGVEVGWKFFLNFCKVQKRFAMSLTCLGLEQVSQFFRETVLIE